MGLTLTARTEDECTLLTLAGELDVYTAPELKARLVTMADEGSSIIWQCVPGFEVEGSLGTWSILLSHRFANRGS